LICKLKINPHDSFIEKIEEIKPEKLDFLVCLANVLGNIKNLIESGKNTLAAYMIESSKHDSTLFFSHNNNGREHAKEYITSWNQWLLRKLEENIKKNFVGEGKYINRECVE